MPKMIFVNLPISDLARSTTFYEALGGAKNPKFSDETSARMVFSKSIYTMLLTHEKYRRFTSRPIADTHTTSADPNPKQDHGFGLGRSIQDPDGHVREIF